MNAVFSVSIWAWVGLVTVVLLLAVYRLFISRGAWTVLHMRRSELSLIPQQIVQGRRLEVIDFWGQTLTIVAFVLGLLLAAWYLYMAVGPLEPVPFPVC